jgi:hypothetical protein
MCLHFSSPPEMPTASLVLFGLVLTLLSGGGTTSIDLTVIAVNALKKKERKSNSSYRIV